MKIDRMEVKRDEVIRKNKHQKGPISSPWQRLLPSVCVGGLAAPCSKANKQARLVERKVCFISDADNWGCGRVANICPKADSCPPPPQAGGENFYRQSVGRWATCRMSTVISLRVIFKLVTAVPTSIVLVVLVNLYFQGPFIPISFQPILRIVTAHVLGKVWSSCS